MRWLFYPVAYLVYALLRGAADNWYPYFFIDVAAIGYGQALTNTAMLVAGVLVVGYVLVGIVFVARQRPRS